MGMEKFIATAQRHHITVAAADTGREYDLTIPQDEADFRALREKLIEHWTDTPIHPWLSQLRSRCRAHSQQAKREE
jgi:hypothetical protein